MLPNFFLVGANKGGTTSMHRYLREHPEIFMSNHKEPTYFALDGTEPPPIGFGKRFVTTREVYEALFDAVDGEKVVGESSTAYLRSKLAPGRIHEDIPHAKVMAILRDPSERAWSAYGMYVSKGFEPVHSFEEVVDRELAGGSRLYVHNGFYSEGLSRWYERFGHDQVRVYLYEDLREDPHRLLREIFEWLDVDPTFTPDVSRRYNETKLPRSRAVKQALEGDSRLKSAIRTIAPKAARHWIKENVQQLNKTKPTGLSPETRRRLVHVFEEDIRKVADLIDRDLSHWLE
jgi:hypothetical protein